MAPKAAAKPAAKPAAKAAAPAKAAPAAKPAAKATKAAAKPAAAPKVQRASDGTAIYIRGLNKNLRASDVYEFFGAYGKIKEVRVRTGKYTLVWFDSQQSAKKALEVNGKQVKGTKVQVEAGRAAGRANKEETATSIYIGKLPGGITKKQVLELVAGNGKVQKLRLSEKKHQAFVYFEDNAAAKKALASVNNKEIRGSKVEVKLSIRSKALDAKKASKRPKLVIKAKVATVAKTAKVAAKTAAKPAVAAKAPAAAKAAPKAAEKAAAPKAEKAAEAPKAAAKAAAPAAAAAKPATKPAAKAAAAPAAKAAAKPAGKKAGGK
jgi:RNA recognition motif-containing protein